MYVHLKVRKGGLPPPGLGAIQRAGQATLPNHELVHLAFRRPG
jgi:hypothetical protein